MSEWKEYKLGDVAIFKNGKSRPTEEGTFPIYGGNGILGYTNQFNSENEVVVVGRVGAYCGSVYYENKQIWISDNALFALPKNRFDTKFLFYFLENLNLNQFAEGSSHPLLTQNLLNSIDVQITDDLEEQKSIASILSSLDDKIDLLHRQNQTLEALAETLFRQWFVEENESLGIAKLKDFCNHLKANVNPLRQPDKIFHHYSIPAFDEGQEPEITLGREIRSNKYQVREGTLLISKLNPRFPRVWPILENVEENHSICSTEFQVIKPKDTGYFGFILCFLKSKTVKDELIQSTGGTSGSHQRVSPDDIFNLTVPVPNDDKLKEFNLITNPYWDKIKNNKRQINTLARLRDTLLPKLMSGEVMVSV